MGDHGPSISGRRSLIWDSECSSSLHLIALSDCCSPMPGRSGFELCSCSECLAANSAGMWIPRARIWGHQAAVEARLAAQTPVDLSLNQSIESRILVQTMLDQDDDLGFNQPNTTHNNSDVQSTDPQGVPSLPVNEIASSIRWIIDGDSTAEHVPLSRHARSKVEKREQCKSTRIAFERLAKFESQALACCEKLLKSSTSYQALCSLGDEIARMFRMVQSVTRRTPLVDEKRTIILGQLRELDALYTQKMKSLGDMVDDLPVNFNSGMWLRFVYHISPSFQDQITISMSTWTGWTRLSRYQCFLVLFAASSQGSVNPLGP
jgi:hypothetical protein